MLHLFKQVYIAFDECLDTSTRYISISEDFGFPQNSVLLPKGQQLGYATSIGKLIGAGQRFNSYLDFLKFCDKEVDAGQEPVIIFVDRNAFVQLATTYFKVLLPNATAQDIYLYLKQYCVKMNLISSNLHFGPNVANFTRLKTKTDITLAEVVQVFNTTPAVPSDYTAFFSDKIATLSIELVAANYSYNQKCAKEIRELIKFFATKLVYSLAEEAKKEIISSAMTAKFRQILNIDNSSLENIVSVLQNADSTKLLFDETIFGKDEIYADYGKTIQTLSPNQLSQVLKTVRVVMSEIIDASLYDNFQTIMLLTDIHNTAQWERNLERFIDFLPNLIDYQDCLKINSMFAHHVIECRKTDRQLLSAYVINGAQ